MTRTRRSVLKLALACAAVPPILGRFAPVLAARTRPAPGFHMVNGWILTDADIVRLRDMGLRIEEGPDGFTA